jgi:hypothetical protein
MKMENKSKTILANQGSFLKEAKYDCLYVGILNLNGLEIERTQ